METKGNIGIFDSGLGGLWILKSLRAILPHYNYVFFGDQANVPYGTKTTEELFECTTKVLAYMYGEKNCACVILACNTTSSAIFTELRAWVEKEYPGRKLFGLVLPTVLAIPAEDPIAIFATTRTIESHAFKDAILAKHPNAVVSEIAMPELASRIEHGEEILEYISSFNTPIIDSVKTGVLCCTHYGIVRADFIKVFPFIETWISQEDIIPEFFKEFLDEKKAFADMLIQEDSLEIYVSKESSVFNEWLAKWYGDDIHPIVVQ